MKLKLTRSEKLISFEEAYQFSVKRAQKEDLIVTEVRNWAPEKSNLENTELKGKEEELKEYQQVVKAMEIKDDLLYYPYTLNEPGGQKILLCLKH